MLRHESRPGVLLTALPYLLALVFGACMVITHYPGYLNPDSIWQLHQIIRGHYFDWHSPTMTFLWSFFPQHGGFISFVNVLLWGGLALISQQTVRRVGWPGLLVMALPFIPGLFNYLGHIHKDVLFTACMLAAFGCAFQANASDGTSRRRWIFAALAWFLSVIAFLIRTNGIFALIPLLIYLSHRWGWRRSSLVTLATLVMLPFAQASIHRALNVVPQHPEASIKVYHLLALSHFQGRNLLPGEWTEEQSRQIVQACYSPVQWDAAAYWGECSFIFTGLEDQQLWGSGELTRAWLQALVNHPFSAYSAMAATFSLSMHAPNSFAMLYPPPRFDHIKWDYPTPLRPSTQWAQNYIQSSISAALSLPSLFTVLFLINGALLLGLRLGSTSLGKMSVALLASGVIYQLTFFPLNVSAEYRYFYWCGYPAYLGLLLTLFAARLPQRPAEDVAAQQAFAWPHALILSVMLATLAALTFNTGFLPQTSRSIKVTPLGDGPLEISQLGIASVPVWMSDQRLPDSELPAGWQRLDGPMLRAETNAAPLELTLYGLPHIVRIKFKSAPGNGHAYVQEHNHAAHSVATAADSAGGEIIVDLPADPAPPASRILPWHKPLISVGLILLITAALMELWKTGIQRRNAVPE